MEGRNKFEQVWRDTPIPKDEDVSAATARQAEEFAETEANRLKNEDIARLRNEAPAQAMELLGEKFDDLSSDERIAAIAKLMDESSEVVDDTNVPKDNGKRFVVEALAEMRTNEEAKREIEPLVEDVIKRVAAERSQENQEAA